MIDRPTPFGLMKESARAFVYVTAVASLLFAMVYLVSLSLGAQSLSAATLTFGTGFLLASGTIHGIYLLCASTDRLIDRVFVRSNAHDQ